MPRHKNSDASRAFAAHLGATMRAVRKSTGLKNIVICQDIGVTQQAVSAWETGRVVPTISLLMAFCKRCNVRMSSVIAEAERLASLEHAQAKLRQQMKEDRARQRRAYGGEA
jgi:transcriptional regulator with XRE-family HTH domain